jgi:3-phenylpropionate/trans-cinnamate dioxygenase ferredoxin component
MPDYIPVAHVDEIPEGTIKGFVVEGKQIAIARCDGDFFAIDGICTHAHAYLSEGYVDTDMCTIECPLHGAQFSLRSGRVRALPATEPVETYPVEIVDEQVAVAVH